MATELKLPDLGVGITDVTISRWLVKEGAPVKIGDILLEVATDKVDTEVPATAAGSLLKINFKAGELAPADAVLGLIGTAGESLAKSEAVQTVTTETPVAHPASTNTGEENHVQENSGEVKASPVAQRVAADKGVDLGALTGSGPGGRITKEDVLASAEVNASKPASATILPEGWSDSPLLEVSRLAAEYNLDLRAIAKGRPLSALTRYDLLSVIEGNAVTPRFVAPSGFTSIAPSTGQSVSNTPAANAESSPKKLIPTESAPINSTSMKSNEELVPHSRMRLAVAKNTSANAFAAPHVTTMWDVEMTAVLAHRSAKKSEFAKAGVNLTVTAYLIEAAIAGLKAVPAANATWTDEGVIIKRSYNIGMAVALPMDQYGMGGLIVPVIKNAGDLNLQGLARAVNEMSDKARKGQLTAADLADGTFTLSNYGTSGSRFQTPIIVQPQVGILGVGAIEKRPIVVSAGHPLESNVGDYLTFRPMTTLGFSYDHRVLDGATADAFCAAVKQHLESYPALANK